MTASVLLREPVTLLEIPVGTGKSIILALSARLTVNFAACNVIIVVPSSFLKQYMRATYAQEMVTMMPSPFTKEKAISYSTMTELLKERASYAVSSNVVLIDEID